MSECKREFHIAGDYIENQTNNFYDHSQYNSTGAVMNEKKCKDARAPKPERKPAVEQPSEYMTFKKRGILEGHVKVLYGEMIKLQWLSKDNNEKDFLDLFSGKLSGCKVVWGSKYGQSTLAFIFEYFVSQGVIAVANGYTVPNILKAHFVDKDGNVFNSLDKKDPPAKKSKPEAEVLLNTLKLNINLQARREDDDDDFTGYGKELPSHLEDDGLRYSTRPH